MDVTSICWYTIHLSLHYGESEYNIHLSFMAILRFMYMILSFLSGKILCFYNPIRQLWWKVIF